MKSPLKFISIITVTLAFQTAAVAETKFDICLAKVQSGAFGVGVDIGGTDNHGRPVNVSVATGLTYDLCVEACGRGQEPFEWFVFSQQFGSWLLPWLALVSQLPFGANDKLDNLESVLLTVGSPTLAAYSLALTVLNGRWVRRQFAHYTYPNARNAIRILNSLQQSPVRVVKDHGLLASLVVLQENDAWWDALARGLNYTHTWSISAGTSIAWVVIAYIFTVVNSFTGDVTNSFNYIGQAVGSLWFWLLPIVLGWLQISPKCDSARLISAVGGANELAHVAMANGPAVFAGNVTEARAIGLTITEPDDLRRDEKCTAPIYNYARFFPWVQAVEDVSEAFQAASDNFGNHKSVNSLDWVPVAIDQPPDAQNRGGTRAQVEEYCTRHPGGGRSRWGPKVIPRMFLASALGLMLQWGTAGAAVVVVWLTPTRGLDCRSGGYLLYAVLSTLVWMLLVTSSVLTHYALTNTHHFQGQVIHHWSTTAAKCCSIAFRWLGKIIATLNTILVVVLCLFQFGNFFNNCFCNSCVIWLRDHAYNVIALLPEDFGAMKAAWAGGVCLASVTGALYVAFVYLLIDPALPD